MFVQYLCEMSFRLGSLVSSQHVDRWTGYAKLSLGVNECVCACNLVLDWHLSHGEFSCLGPRDAWDTYDHNTAVTEADWIIVLLK